MDVVTTILELVGLALLVTAIVLLGIVSPIAGLAAGGVLALFVSWSITGRRVAK